MKKSLLLISFFILAGALLLVPAKPVLVISSREDMDVGKYEDVVKLKI